MRASTRSANNTKIRASDDGRERLLLDRFKRLWGRVRLDRGADAAAPALALSACQSDAATGEHVRGAWRAERRAASRFLRPGNDARRLEEHRESPEPAGLPN